MPPVISRLLNLSQIFVHCLSLCHSAFRRKSEMQCEEIQSTTLDASTCPQTRYCNERVCCLQST